MAMAGKSGRKRTSMSTRSGDPSSRTRVSRARSPEDDSEVDPYEFRGTQSLQLTVTTTPGRKLQSPRTFGSASRRVGKPKKSPAQRKEQKLQQLDEENLQRAIEESKKQLQLEERRRRVHKRVLLSGPAELVSPSAMNKLGKQRQAMKGCGSRKAATETISTQEVQVENFVIRKRGGGEEGGEREAEEECTQDDLSSVADICNGQDTAARPEHTESKVAAGDCVLGNNSVTEDEGGESPSVLSNVLGVPVPITYSPCAGQPLPCEEQQQQRQAQPDLLERSGMDEEESDAHNVCEDHSSSLSMCTTLEERVSEEEVERKKVPSNCEASPVVHEKQRQESEPPLKRMKLTRTRQSQSLDAKLRSCSWAADGSHSKTESSQSSGSGSHQELSADLSPQNQQQKELSHLSSLSPSNKPSSPPQPSASTMDAPSSRFSSHCTKLILQRLTAYTIQLRAAQDGVLQRVPWGKPICADQTQPSNSLDPHQPVRRSKRTRDQQEKSLELYCCKGNKKIHAAQEEEENSVDEFMEAADPPPHALQQTARRTNTDLVAPWLGTRKGVKENMLHTTTGCQQHTTKTGRLSLSLKKNTSFNTSRSSETSKSGDTSRGELNITEGPGNDEEMLQCKTDMVLGDQHMGQRTAVADVATSKNNSGPQLCATAMNHKEKQEEPEEEPEKEEEKEEKKRVELEEDEVGEEKEDKEEEEKDKEDGKLDGSEMTGELGLTFDSKDTEHGRPVDLAPSSSSPLTPEHTLSETLRSSQAQCTCSLQPSQDDSCSSNSKVSASVSRRLPSKNCNKKRRRIVAFESSDEEEEEIDHEIGSKLVQSSLNLHERQKDGCRMVGERDEREENSNTPVGIAKRIEIDLTRESPPSSSNKTSLGEREHDVTSSTETNMSCPLCLQCFPAHEIEQHAATCRDPSTTEEEGEERGGNVTGSRTLLRSRQRRQARLSGVQRTPRHDAFVQMLQQEQDEVEDFSSSGSSGCEGFHSQFVQTHQQPRKMRRRAKRMLNGSGNNRDKKDTVVREDDLIIVEETGFQQGEEEAEGEEEGESRTTPPVEYNPCQMTEDGGFVVDPSAISDSPIRSYQQIGSLVGKSSIDYSNQFSSRGRGQRQMSSSSTRGSCRARHSRGRSHNSGHQKRFFAGRRGKGKGKSGPTRGKKGRR